VLPFVFTESSGAGTTADYEANSSLTMIDAMTGQGREFLMDGKSREMRIRCCLQGLFADLANVKSEGLAVQHRAGSSGAWTTARVIRGWAYANERDEGATVTDYGGEEFTVVADGGWRDVTVSIPDTAKQVRIQPLVIFNLSQHIHDIAVQEIELTYEV